MFPPHYIQNFLTSALNQFLPWLIPKLDHTERNPSVSVSAKVMIYKPRLKECKIHHLQSLT